MIDRRSIEKDRALHTYRFPTVGQSVVVCAYCDPLEVNMQGFLLIAEALKTSNHPSPPIQQMNFVGITGGWLLDTLAANVTSVPLRIVDLKLAEVHCGTVEAAKAFVEMLKHCDHWRVDTLYVLGNVDNNFWEDLSSAMPIGPILRDASDGMLRFVRASSRSLARGKPDQLRRVWRFTGGFASHWWVYGPNHHPKIYRRTDSYWGYGVAVDRESAGWEEIMSAIRKVVSVDMDPVY